MTETFAGFADFTARIQQEQQRARTGEVLDWVIRRFPQLTPRIAWNQPMFTDHGTFIIGFSVSRQHLAAAPEKAAIERFSADIRQAGYDHSQQLLRIRWEQPIPFALLERIIRFNVEDKAACSSFWRK